jgi:hypothetical protein
VHLRDLGHNSHIRARTARTPSRPHFVGSKRRIACGRSNVAF